MTEHRAICQEVKLEMSAMTETTIIKNCAKITYIPYIVLYVVSVRGSIIRDKVKFLSIG